ncbi:hypothetical protein SAMN05421504_101198 [Amycolatopsis xylanica]|uniref:Uncharacterized protein n=1 Tax=Amycolatopsis xylanica TaxID=589385 RepID=A0A1H2SG79_9PSEU|nr:hypothetical protein [Amycolatopsis xylanica]SDW30029.1 hypothetical protein SAMN05421504_101198 [Amycolatopsis xylanica]
MSLADDRISPWLDGVDIYVDNARNREVLDNRKIQAAHAGPGFSLDKDEATRMLEQARAIRKELQDVQHKAEFLEKMDPPAKDPVSCSYNGSVTWCGEEAPGAFAYGAGHLRLEALYLNELIERLRKALGIVEAEDEHAAGEAAQAGAVTGGNF